MIDQRIHLLRENMKKAGIDTVWIINPENRRYLSGFSAEDLMYTESSGSLLITLTEAILITDKRYQGMAQKEACGFDVIFVEESPFLTLFKLLKRLNSKVLGIEETYLSYGQYRYLKKAVKEEGIALRVRALKDMILKMRLIKDNSEIKDIRKACKITSSIMKAIKGHLRPGLREREMVWIIKEMAYHMGIDAFSFPPIVASGPNSAIPHASSGNRKIRAGEPVIVDIGVKVNGYCSDMTRTFFLGAPKREFKKIYDIVCHAQKEAIKKILPGITCKEADSISRNIIEQNGYGPYFVHSLGHGLGLCAHELPRLSKKEESLLKEGMVVTIEPGIYIPKRGGVRIEDTAVITKRGLRLLTDPFDPLKE